MCKTPAVLVVDDDASTAGLFVAVIKYLGLAPRTAGDGREALAIIAAERPHAVILDLVMPELDGFEVLRILKSTAPDLLQRIIVVTAAAGQRVDHCRELDRVWKFLRKPVDIDQLGDALLGCVGAAAERSGRGSAHEALPRP